MKQTLTAIMATAMLSIASQANASEPSIKRGMMFLDARSILIKAGWKGIILHETVSNEDGPNYLDEQARPYYKLGVHEVDACAGGNHPTCLFHYRKGNECLTVVTYGEKPHDSFVTHWMNTCGD